jgi:aryl-alcohol dehydrogenase-like predicted oxidoreductase
MTTGNSTDTRRRTEGWTGMDPLGQANVTAATMRLGRTGIEVSRLGLGGAPMGGRIAPVPKHQVCDLLDRFFDLGLTLIDTAARYQDGQAERDLGEYLATRPRSSCVISTKVSVATGVRDRGAALRLRVTESLARLRRERLDIALVHDPYDLSPGELADDIATLAALRPAGLVGAVGVGVGDVQILLRALESPDIDCVLVSGAYTVLDHTAADELLPLCAQRRIGVLLGTMFHSGVLATGLVAGARFGYDVRIPANVRQRVGDLTRLCSSYGVDLAQVALQFGLAHPAVAAVLVGTTRPAHLDQLHSWSRRSVPPEFWAAAGLPSPAPPNPRRDSA